MVVIIIVGMGERLRKLRESRNLKVKQIADRLGCEGQTINGYESDSHEPRLTTLVKLAEVLGTSTDFILGRTPENYIDLSNLSLAQRKILIAINKKIITYLDSLK